MVSPKQLSGILNWEPGVIHLEHEELTLPDKKEMLIGYSDLNYSKNRLYFTNTHTHKDTKKKCSTHLTTEQTEEYIKKMPTFPSSHSLWFKLFTWRNTWFFSPADALMLMIKIDFRWEMNLMPNSVLLLVWFHLLFSFGVAFKHTASKANSIQHLTPAQLSTLPSLHR